ncbi:MAG: winged helix-turn-helix transcriptional regulator [Caldilineaceae bacterium]|nr:winged helix-turn-helix transcriptional regulator [Caldilineaceae bacterium]
MPKTLRLPDGSYMRRLDVHHILQFLHAMQCVQVVGFSNIGKSALLRLLAQPDVRTQELGEAGHEYLAVYVDCNRMLEMSDQGFYELVLRCLQESSPQAAALPELAAAYEMLVAPASEFQVPLGFNRGVTAVLQSIPQKLVLLFDEFDEPFGQIDSRVFLNLRALRDRHSNKLAYVTATCQPLRAPMEGHHSAEFCELFAHHAWYLAPLTRPDVDRLVRRYMDAYEAQFTDADLDFVYQWAGGHPAMVNGVCSVLDAALDARGRSHMTPSARLDFHQGLVRRMHADEHLQQECATIWAYCSPDEQNELLALCWAQYQPNRAILDDLMRKYLVLRVEGHYQMFCRLLYEYVRRKTLRPPSAATRLWVDVDSGEVLVDGKPVETLTNLEYRLMLLLFYNADKIVDKYSIVADVWGDGYLDEVDDARIEKLISRLRQKIEPDQGSPRFLTTVRGRGYRLALGNNSADSAADQTPAGSARANNSLSAAPGE